MIWYWGGFPCPARHLSKAEGPGHLCQLHRQHKGFHRAKAPSGSSPCLQAGWTGAAIIFFLAIFYLNFSLSLSGFVGVEEDLSQGDFCFKVLVEENWENWLEAGWGLEALPRPTNCRLKIASNWINKHIFIFLPAHQNNNLSLFFILHRKLRVPKSLFKVFDLQYSFVCFLKESCDKSEDNCNWMQILQHMLTQTTLRFF